MDGICTSWWRRVRPRRRALRRGGCWAVGAGGYAGGSSAVFVDLGGCCAKGFGVVGAAAPAMSDSTAPWSAWLRRIPPPPGPSGTAPRGRSRRGVFSCRRKPWWMGRRQRGAGGEKRSRPRRSAPAYITHACWWFGGGGGGCCVGLSQFDW